jgi:hypothetical protein
MLFQQLAGEAIQRMQALYGFRPLRLSLRTLQILCHARPVSDRDIRLIASPPVSLR